MFLLCIKRTESDVGGILCNHLSRRILRKRTLQFIINVKNYLHSVCGQISFYKTERAGGHEITAVFPCDVYLEF